jgi:hypothetical protein
MNIKVIIRNIEYLLYLINVKATKVLWYHNLNQNLCYKKYMEIFVNQYLYSIVINLFLL